MYISFNNERCKTRLFLIVLNLVELNYCPFMITLDKCNGNYNNFKDISDKICVPNTEDVYLSVFNLITRKNESKTLQNIWYVNVNVNFMVKNVIQIKLGITANVNASAKIQEKMCARKVILGILPHAVVKMVDMQEALLTVQ